MYASKTCLHLHINYSRLHNKNEQYLHAQLYYSTSKGQSTQKPIQRNSSPIFIIYTFAPIHYNMASPTCVPHYLTFVVNYAFYTIKVLVFVSRKGYISCYYDFIIAEAWEFIKRLLLWTWLFLFYVTILIEIAVFMLWAYPLLLG